jgi:hypothetical protein
MPTTVITGRDITFTIGGNNFDAQATTATLTGETGSLCEILWGVAESAPDTAISTVFTATSGAVFTFQVLPMWPSAGGTAPDAQTVSLSFQVIGVPAETF